MKAKGLVRYPADYRTLITVLGFGVFIVFSWMIWPTVSLGWKIALVFALCNMQFVNFCIIHNVVHSPVFSKKRWNKAFQYYLTVLCGNQVSGFVPGHNLSHHMNLQTAKDTCRTTRARFKWNFLNQMLFFFFMAKDIFMSEQRFKKKMKETNPRWYKQFVTEQWLITAFKVGLLLIDWERGLFLIWIPGLYGIWALFGTNYWQHDGCHEGHEYNHSRTFTNPLLNFLIFNNGYHGAHHMKPNLHWSLYPKWHEENLAPYCHPNLNRNSLAVYMWEVLVYPGKRVDFLGNPVVLPPDVPSEDWVEQIDNSERIRTQLGAVQ